MRPILAAPWLGKGEGLEPVGLLVVLLPLPASPLKEPVPDALAPVVVGAMTMLVLSEVTVAVEDPMEILEMPMSIIVEEAPADSVVGISMEMSRADVAALNWETREAGRRMPSTSVVMLTAGVGIRSFVLPNSSDPISAVTAMMEAARARTEVAEKVFMLY